MDSFNILGATGTFGVTAILFNLALTLVLAVAIVYVYRKTHRGFSYSQNFTFTLVIMSLLTTVVMMVVGNNLAVAFGLLGAFAIIRFRTVIKETRDTGFVFFALAIGMAVGTGSHLIAVISTAFVLAVIWVLYKYGFGSIYHNDYLLTFTVNRAKNPPDSFGHIFERHLKNSMLVNMSAKGDSPFTEMVYSVRLVSELKSGEFLKALSETSGVEEAHLISAKSDVEY
ncbi:MAG: DUF4956 domain-containing protein [Parcubacteria group bacterium]|nr:DUF4956 domain-containing protein [Parcubacteria group bacterium]MBI3075316.1 DUF4956 domain-containing protein [Parcubacteria group bacterium]